MKTCVECGKPILLPTCNGQITCEGECRLTRRRRRHAKEERERRAAKAGKRAKASDRLCEHCKLPLLAKTFHTRFHPECSRERNRRRASIWAKTPHGREVIAAAEAKPHRKQKSKATRRDWLSTPKGVEYRRRATTKRKASPERMARYHECMREWQQSPEGRARRKDWLRTPSGLRYQFSMKRLAALRRSRRQLDLYLKEMNDDDSNRNAG